MHRSMAAVAAALLVLPSAMPAQALEGLGAARMAATPLPVTTVQFHGGRGGGASGGGTILPQGGGGGGFARSGNGGGGAIRPGVGQGNGFGRGAAVGGLRPGVGQGIGQRPVVGGLGGAPVRGVVGNGQFARGNGGVRPFRDRRGVGIGAGVAGFAAGAVVGGALANRGYYGGGYYGGYGDDSGYDPGYADDNGYQGADPAVADSDDTVAYCEHRYRSYDPESGTFLGNDGERHPCP